LAIYGHAFKDKAVARLLPPDRAALEVVARLEALITIAAMIN
jgi:hypothetical protein